VNFTLSFSYDSPQIRADLHASDAVDADRVAEKVNHVNGQRFVELTVYKW
jgi:hypothetical protein